VTTDLSAAIDTLYAAFALVPRPTAIVSCPCCHAPLDVRALPAPVPLRDLPPEALTSYAADVMLTSGDAGDLRYFLPRLLEVSAAGGFAWPGPEVVVGKLRLAGWQTWRDEECAAVRGYLAALWTATLASEPAERDADTALCAIGNAEDDLTPYLAEWTSVLTRPTAAAQLLVLLGDGCRSVRGTRWLANGFWGDRDQQAGQVVSWLGGTELRLAVAAAYEAADDDGARLALIDVDDLL
jgi:hypothetical protein